MAKSSSAAARRRDRKTEKKESGPAPGVGGIVRRDLLAILTSRSFRETVESVVIAFALAFLFRTFEAEAFVIPTGSMAPTLQGRHQAVDCPMCNYSYRISASLEIQQATEVYYSDVAVGTCPNCRYSACTNEVLGQIKDQEPAHVVPFNVGALQRCETSKSRNGNRILVSKFIYEFQEPARWDVFVFRFPGQSSRNYIKRLVGLPGETIQIEQGDLYRSDYDIANLQPRINRQFQITRKEPRKLQAMLHLVHDNDYLAQPLRQAGWPDRWTPWPRNAEHAPGGWLASDDGRSFQTDGQAPADAWIRYQHFVPSWDDWENILAPGGLAGSDPARAQLITDTYAYNTSGAYEFDTEARGPKQYYRGGPRFADITALGLHWVGDLVVECDLQVNSKTGTALIELVEGGRRFACEFDVETGRARLSIDGGEETFGEGDDVPTQHPSAATSVTGLGTYHVAMANVDNQLLVWIDGDLVEFDGPTEYRRLGNGIPKYDPVTGGDLAPVGIGSKQAALQVSGLRILRDVYYIATKSQSHNLDYIHGPFGRNETVTAADANFEDVRLEFLSTPSKWPKAFRTMSRVEFDLARNANDPQKDQFLAMGDNSPQSKDSRLWSTRSVKYYVQRKLLIGKALSIYWPPTHIQFVR